MCVLEKFICNLQELLTGAKRCDNNIIRKHNRKLEQLGDMSFPLNIKNWYHLIDFSKLQTHSPETIFDCHFSEVDLNMQIQKLKEYSKNWEINIERAEVNCNDVRLYLQRSSYFLKTIIGGVLNKNSMYGSSEVIHKDITLNMDFDVNAHQTAEIDLSTLRLLILKDVTSNLLTFTAKSTNEGSCNIVFTMNSLTSCHPCILCGPVLNSDGMKDNNTKAGELLTKRAADMRMMAQHKYGVQIKPNASWKIYFEKLGRAAVTIEMLSNKPLKALKLNMHDLQTANKGASFIFYNCARLAVLFKELHKRISEGIYPSLPDIEDVDFSVLNQPEEWELFYVYILQFPITIKHCIRDIEKGTVNPQYLISFLSSLSSVFSAYYRRVRILTDPREHLFGILHARVYLLEAVQCVFHNALFLLNIEPIKEM